MLARVRSTRAFIHPGGNAKVSLWKVGSFLKTKHTLLYDSAIKLLDIYLPPKVENFCTYQKLNTDIKNSFSHNSLFLEVRQCPLVGEGMNKL
jgi:hypothetical protein